MGEKSIKVDGFHKARRSYELWRKVCKLLGSQTCAACGTLISEGGDAYSFSFAGEAHVCPEQDVGYDEMDEKRIYDILLRMASDKNFFHKVVDSIKEDANVLEDLSDELIQKLAIRSVFKSRQYMKKITIRLPMSRASRGRLLEQISLLGHPCNVDKNDEFVEVHPTKSKN